MFATGTYVGNGAATQAIVGVGFQPKGIIIYEQRDVNLFTPQYKITQDGLWCDLFAGLLGGFFDYRDVDMIISLDADGFTVGNGASWNNTVNINAVTYAYIAFS